MRNIAICGSSLEWLTTPDNFVETIEIEAVSVHCGLIHTPEPDFMPDAPMHREQVLVQKRAFSCNYRDKGFILKMATRGPLASFYTVGSEFVGEIVAVGAAVTQLQVGDRVIADNHYPDAKVAGVAPGIPSNQGSKEYQILHPAKLMRVPDSMPDDVAAAFGLGAQTSYSIVRKLNLSRGDRVLVTSARSNTSLFVIQALRKYDVEVYATTTSSSVVERLKAMGVDAVVVVDPSVPTLKEDLTIGAIAHPIGGFNAVVDPFFDLHLGRVVGVMAPGARYVTCGFYDQYSHFTGKPFDGWGHSMREIMETVMFKNLSLIGNCLGQTSDLTQALHDYGSGALQLTLDSVFVDQQVGAFFERTYNSSDRFGKVVYSYV